MAKHVVGTVSEIPPGTRKIVEIAGRTIGVFNVNGEFFAVRNTCPHQGGPLCSGAQTGLRMATVPGEYSYTRKGEILRCPWHGWEFDIRTGQSWWNPEEVRTRAYPVHIESLPASPVPPAQSIECGSPAEMPSDRQPGPYTAETYPVTVENRVAPEKAVENHAPDERMVVVEVPGGR
jgi:3-phenylpropionate/trans-cinnamate dioxygenase ferredoxin subunit